MAPRNRSDIAAHDLAQTDTCHRWRADIFVEKLVRSRFVGPWQRLLDLSAGNGQEAVRYAQLGYLVDAVAGTAAEFDAARQMAQRDGLEQRCRFAPRVSMLMEYPDATFDVIVTRRLPAAGERRWWADNINRLLKPGGVALFIVPVRHTTAMPQRDAALTAPTAAWSAVDVRDLERSFESVMIERFTILGRIDRALPDVTPVLRARLKQLDYRLLRVCPAFAAATTDSVLVCRKRLSAGAERRAAA